MGVQAAIVFQTDDIWGHIEIRFYDVKKSCEPNTYAVFGVSTGLDIYAPTAPDVRVIRDSCGEIQYPEIPQQQCNFLDSEIKTVNERGIMYFFLPVLPDKDFVATYDKLWELKNGFKYNLATNNCADAAQLILKTIGYDDKALGYKWPIKRHDLAFTPFEMFYAFSQADNCKFSLKQLKDALSSLNSLLDSDQQDINGITFLGDDKQKLKDFCSEFNKCLLKISLFDEHGKDFSNNDILNDWYENDKYENLAHLMFEAQTYKLLPKSEIKEFLKGECKAFYTECENELIKCKENKKEFPKFSDAVHEIFAKKYIQEAKKAIKLLNENETLIRKYTARATTVKNILWNMLSSFVKACLVMITGYCSTDLKFQQKFYKKFSKVPKETNKVGELRYALKYFNERANRIEAQKRSKESSKNCEETTFQHVGFNIRPRN